MKIIIRSWLFIFLTIRVTAQTNVKLNPGIENIIPPSPNAAALGKFGDIPVGPSTGIPQITIPVFNYESKTNELKLSVSLDYHAGGVRVDEMASNVGIGWALNAGGVVTRTLRGIADEVEDYGFLYSTLPQSPTDGNAGADPSGRSYDLISNDQLDGQNDIFNFNFNGHTGKFMLGKNNDFLMLSMQQVKVEKEIQSGNIVKFMLTDEAGYKYAFEAIESTLAYNLAYHSTYNSSWYLTRVISPAGLDTIKLDYENTSYEYAVASSASISFSATSALPSKPYQATSIGQKINGKRLKKITFSNNAEMSFIYSNTTRGDLPGDYALEKISISDGISKRGYKLLYDYSLNRLTLKKAIPFSGASETEDTPYELEYRGTLPDRLSLRQDHWGFFNNNSTTSFFPEEYLAGPIGSIGEDVGYVYLPGGTRATDSVLCLNGSLSKIIYPTKGYTIFDMEVNKAEDERLIHKLEVLSKFRDSSISFSCKSGTTTTATFPYKGDPNGTTDITFSLTGSGQCSGSCMVYVYLKDASGNTINYFEIPVPATGVPPSKSFTVANLVPTQTYTLSAGTMGLQNYNGFIGVSWRETRKQNPVPFTVGYAELCVGGLRAKKISHYDNNSSIPALVTEYEYTMEDGKSSGTLGVYPVYSNVVEYDFRTTIAIPPDYIEPYSPRFPFITRSSSSIYALANVNGSPVTYKRVVERTSGNGSYLGRTERFFTTFSDHPVLTDKPYPFAPPRYSDWKYGLLQKELIYDNSNFLIRKTENSYKYTTDMFYNSPTRFDNFRSVSTAPVKFLYLGIQSGYGDFWSNQGPRPLYNLGVNFYPDAGRVDLEKTTTYEYDATGGVLQTTVNYEYDPVNFYVKAQQVVNSKGNTLRKQYNYPKDMLGGVNDPNGIYQAMGNSHIINPVIEEIQLKDNVQILLTKKNYYNPYTNVYVPQTNQIRIGSLPIETRMRYHEYSNKGNIRSVSMDNDVITSYIWGYKSQYPVAKIVGSSYTNASQYITQSILDNMSTTDSQMRAELDNIRINLPNALVTTYTYAPLLGITSETDSRGATIYYEYDGFGRLKLVKDQNGKILKQYDYQFQKPITQ